MTMSILLLSILLIFLVPLALLKVIAICMIFSKAGYSWALGLLMFVPVVNIIIFLVLGFSDWPISKEILRLKQQQNVPTI
jgi:hypothetical protein